MPASSAFTPAERRLIARLRTPEAVQAWLNRLPYNTEPPPGGATLRSFRGVVRHQTAHCFEAALAAAVVLEQHGWPPLVVDLESQDGLDHVLHLYRIGRRWGSIARSRDEGLHGRKAAYRSVRDLVYSYVDPYVDGSGRITGWGVFHLDELTRADWRLGEGNVWSVERALIAAPHRPLRTSDRRFDHMLRRYRAFKARWPQQDPGRVRGFYAGRERWL